MPEIEMNNAGGGAKGIKASFGRVIAWAKKHPVIAGGLLLLVVVLGYLAYKRSAARGSSESASPTGTSQAMPDSASAGGLLSSGGASSGTSGGDLTTPLPNIPAMPSLEFPSLPSLSVPSYSDPTLAGGGVTGGGGYVLSDVSGMSDTFAAAVGLHEAEVLIPRVKGPAIASAPKTTTSAAAVNNTLPVNHPKNISGANATPSGAPSVVNAAASVLSSTGKAVQNLMNPASQPVYKAPSVQTVTKTSAVNREGASTSTRAKTTIAPKTTVKVKAY